MRTILGWSALALALSAAMACNKINGISELQIAHSSAGGASAATCSGAASPCGMCVQTSCCSEAAACTASASCTECVSSDTPAASCASDSAAQAYLACAKKSCDASCF